MPPYDLKAHPPRLVETAFRRCATREEALCQHIGRARRNHTGSLSVLAVKAWLSERLSGKEGHVTPTCLMCRCWIKV
jgi:hypothetical protein